MHARSGGVEASGSGPGSEKASSPAAGPVAGPMYGPNGHLPTADIDIFDLVRERLRLDTAISDVTIAVSLTRVAAGGEGEARRLAASQSPLGRLLERRGGNLDIELAELEALAQIRND